MWYGWLIEQSLDDQSVFNKLKTVKMQPVSESSTWKSHVVAISENDLTKTLFFLKQHLKPAWYAHLVKDNEIIVVFRSKDFRSSEGSDFSKIEKYGVAHGVPKEQMEIAPLFDLAREMGF